MESNFSIDVIYDAEVGVFVGTSKDILGLTVEEESIHKFFETAMDIVPYLLEKNLNVIDNDNDVVNVHIVLKNLLETKLKQVNPIYSWHTEPDYVHATA